MQRPPIPPDRLQQPKCSHDVGFNELAWPVNRAVHMAFGGKVEHRARLVRLQQLVDQGTVTDIPLHKHMVGIVLQTAQRFQVAGIGQFVKVHN